MKLFRSLFPILVLFFACLAVPAWGKGAFDGPAELPRVSVASAMSDTPAPGSIVTVPAGGDLQAALDKAHCGDTVELEAGAVFLGRFYLRAKNCDAGHWIVVRTSADDSLLPGEGQRMTPCYGGVASLPGRPDYNCVNPQNVLARIENNTMSPGPLVMSKGANHYRLIGLEVTRSAGLSNTSALLSPDLRGTNDHVVVDRCWFHGTVQDETRNGISLRGATNFAVVDSYLNDFHCTASSGICTDAHAIGGGNGDHQDGPFKIENNFLEASGEAVMFGGGAATTTPTDIVVRRNHFFKPMQWMKGQPDFVGGVTGNPFVVKNHLELKNAIRVLIEANLMENSWGGFTQTGRAIVLSPKNQHTKRGAYVCPLCQVTDVTIRYVRIAHAGGGMAFSTGCDLGCKNSKKASHGGQALAGARFSVHDVVMDDISKKYVGGGNLFLIENGWSKHPLNTVTINHVTGFPDEIAHLALFGNSRNNPAMYGLVFTNNMMTTARYPLWSSGGGRSSCAAKGTPAQKVRKCFTTSTFKNNALIGTPDPFPPSSWPAGNFFPADAKAAGFVDFSGGDYRLQPGSRYAQAGSDGKDLGADIAGLNAALDGVE